MSIIWNLVKRNAKIFLRDKASVFFSFLSILIIILLYAAFLAEQQVSSIEHNVGDVEGIRWLVDSWIMAGLITVNAVTIPLSMLGQIIEDNESKSIYDFYSAPIKRYQLVLSYIFAAWLVGFVLAFFNLVVAQVYIVLSGGQLLSFIEFVKTIGIICIFVFSFSAISFFIITFIKSRQALGVLSTIIGTFIGFISGVYIPIGVLSESVQKVLKVFPYTHGAVILRRIFMERPIEKVFYGADGNIVKEYNDVYGYNLYINDHNLGIGEMLLYIICIGVIFYILSIIRINKFKRK